MKAFGKRPLGRLVYHLYACLFAVCDEVAVWFASLEPLVFHYFLQNLETQLQQAVVQFFIIKVFGDDGEYGFYDFAADGVGVDEGNDQIRHLFSAAVVLDGEDEGNEGLQDGVIELHYFSVSLGKHQRVEGVGCEEIADHAQQLELY